MCSGASPYARLALAGGGAAKSQARPWSRSPIVSASARDRPRESAGDDAAGSGRFRRRSGAARRAAAAAAAAAARRIRSRRRLRPVVRRAMPLARALRPIVRRVLPLPVRRFLHRLVMAVEAQAPVQLAGQFSDRPIMLKDLPALLDAECFAAGPIILVDNSLAWGGAERQVVTTLKGLAPQLDRGIGLLCLRLGEGPEYDFCRRWRVFPASSATRSSRERRGASSPPHRRTRWPVPGRRSSGCRAN